MRDFWDNSIYRTRAILGRSRFEAALIYKPRILDLKNEEFPFLIHKLSVIKPQLKWNFGKKKYKPRLIMARVRYSEKEGHKILQNLHFTFVLCT